VWQWEPHYRAAASGMASRLFQTLDDNLAPKLSLIGFLAREGKAKRPPVSISPPESPCRPEWFRECIVSPSELRWSLPHYAYDHPEGEALRDAILAAVAKQESQAGLVTFCSRPRLVGDYLICTLLQLDRQAHARGPRLTDVPGFAHGDRVTISLLDAAIEEFLLNCEREILNPKPIPGQQGWLSVAETLRHAGATLTSRIGFRANSQEGFYVLFQACNSIAATPYEGLEGTGDLVVARRGHPNVQPHFTLATPVSVSEFRTTRKLLQLTGTSLNLLSDCDTLYGVGKITGKYDPESKDLFVISFVKHYTWDLRHADQCLMRVAYGQPRLPKPGFQARRMAEHLRELFPSLTESEVERLRALAEAACEERHGTIFVVSACAAEEARRLEQECIRLEPIALTPETLPSLTAIDGAVLVDVAGRCHAIGVILDGLATPEGDRGRGARYNSALRYAAGTKHPCLAVVKSEDGMINFIPSKERVNA
jgi:DNA integrity scanning protein DisA with diadenylate cyclase activity